MRFYYLKFITKLITWQIVNQMFVLDRLQYAGFNPEIKQRNVDFCTWWLANLSGHNVLSDGMTFTEDRTKQVKTWYNANQSDGSL